MAQTIIVNATPIGQRPILYFSQGDIGREFNINVASSDGYSIPSGATAKIQATKPSGFGFSVAGTVTDNTVAFSSTETMTNEAGFFPAELHITKNSDVIGTLNFMMSVEANPRPDGTIDGDAESAIPELTLLVERVEAAAESIHDLSVDATTLSYNADATATYDDELNKISFGIPRGGALTVTDPNSDGNIVISFS